MQHDFTYWSNRAERQAIQAINATCRAASDAHDEIVRCYVRKARRLAVQGLNSITTRS